MFKPIAILLAAILLDFSPAFFKMPEKQDFFKRILKQSANKYKGSSSQFFKTKNPNTGKTTEF